MVDQPTGKTAHLAKDYSISCTNKYQTYFKFHRAVKRLCVCVCVCVCDSKFDF